MYQWLDTEGGTSTTQCDVSRLPPTKEIHSPLLFRSDHCKLRWLAYDGSKQANLQRSIHCHQKLGNVYSVADAP
jgi:hypothetical protein